MRQAKRKNKRLQEIEKKKVEQHAKEVAKESFHIHVQAVQMMSFFQRWGYCWKILWRIKFK